MVAAVKLHYKRLPAAASCPIRLSTHHLKHIWRLPIHKFGLRLAIPRSRFHSLPLHHVFIESLNCKQSIDIQLLRVILFNSPYKTALESIVYKCFQPFLIRAKIWAPMTFSMTSMYRTAKKTRISFMNVKVMADTPLLTGASATHERASAGSPRRL